MKHLAGDLPQMTHWDIHASPDISVGTNVFRRSVHITQVDLMCYHFSDFCFCLLLTDQKASIVRSQRDILQF